MKASYNWLRDILGASFDASPNDVAQHFTNAGLEVEGTSSYGAASRSVVVAKVVSIEPHPSKAKLSLVTVEAGRGPERVVCGAPNVPAPGGLVVLARLGTHLPAKGLTLEPREIAGVRSEGMLCSEAELGLRISGGEGGILILPEGTGTVGQPLSEALPSSCDTILEIGLTPNRPDGLGHLGLARELAALYRLPFRHEALRPKRVDASLSVDGAAQVRIDDPERCPTWGGAYVRGVKVEPSPLWMQYRLEALGVRAISNVVDITNWIMLKFGHPIHGFDRQAIRKGTIIVRRANADEPVQTLDGIHRKLSQDDLVIADGEGTVALAGVMGAEGSGIQTSTTEVLVECAYFTPRGVRRTARRHGMHSDSSHRFERGVDPGDVTDVLHETAALLCDIAGGTAAPEPKLFGPGVPAPKAITLRKDRMDALLGMSISMADAQRILESLGCRAVKSASSDTLAFVPPTHRPDLSIEVDLIEEVVRLSGVDRVPSIVPAIRPAAPRTHDALPSAITRAAIEVGLSQALTYAFTSPAALEAVGAPAATFTLLNPMTDDRSVMRTSLLPGLFDALRRARRHGVENVRLFTVGPRFLPQEGSLGRDGSLAHEAKSFAAVIAGNRDVVLTKEQPVDVYDAKGVATAVVERATRRRVKVRPAEPRPEHLHPRAAGALFVDGTQVGTFGVIHPILERRLELDGSFVLVEIDIEALEKLGVRTPKYKPIPTLPASTRDLSVSVSDDVPAGDVESAIVEAAGELAESVELIDLYRSESIGKDKRSLTFHVVYRDPKAATDPDRARTLTDAEVDERHNKVIKTVHDRFGAELRS
ncbi:MAG: phenylalanine--tRNA ligase subunit beta [Polyangiaceae bacterium]|nr:phenylalanine--tRNA ligase subunit beta [Polyangiaceae bacterium]